MSGFVFLLMAIFGIVVVVISVNVSRKTDEAWSSVAQRLNLHFTPGGLLASRCLSGVLMGNAVMVDTFTRGSGKNSRTCTRYRVSYPHPLGLGLQLTKQGFFSGFASLFGAQDIEVGDGAFDGEVVVKGADPRRVSEFLTPSRRLRCHRLLTAFDGVSIRDAEIYLESRGTERNAERIIEVLKRMASLSWHLADDRDVDEQIDRAIEVQREGQLDKALSYVRNAFVDPEEDDVDAHVLEGEILYTGGQVEEAATVFEKVRQAMPTDSEVTAWAQSAAQAARAAPSAAMPAPTNDPTANPQPVAAPTSDAINEAKSVCEDLFDPKRMSHQINERFEEQYVGRPVRWSGVLQRVSSFTFDLVFGDEKGTKAVFEVHEVAGSTYGGKMVQAVVHLADDELERLRTRTGERLTFEGRLVRCDAFMRNLFVADGAMVGI